LIKQIRYDLVPGYTKGVQKQITPFAYPGVQACTHFYLTPSNPLYTQKGRECNSLQQAIRTEREDWQLAVAEAKNTSRLADQQRINSLRSSSPKSPCPITCTTSLPPTCPAALLRRPTPLWRN
jgi:hypothetical protein